MGDYYIPPTLNCQRKTGRMTALDGCTVDKCVIKIFCCTKHMALDILKSERNIMIQEPVFDSSTDNESL